jgi:hypothetical protein
MGRFETPTSNPNLAAKLQGLDLQAVTIARSEEQTTKLDDFVATYVTPETLDYTVNDTTHSYQYRRISALGQAGTLLHARMHAYPLIDIEPGIRNIVIVDSIDAMNAEELWPARSSELNPGPMRSAETVLEVVGYAQELETNLWPVLDDTTEGEWQQEQELARILEQEALLSGTPQVRFGNGGWTYRHANGTFEPLRDLVTLQKGVHLAVSRGLGRAAVGQLEQYEAGHPLQLVRSGE